MARIVRSALFQATWPGSKEKMIEKHVRAAEEAAKHGAQIMCWQELFYGPYFCQVQDVKHYSWTEHIPDGPTTQLAMDLARRSEMVLIVPVYEEDQPGVYYNTAAVIDADGAFLGKYRKTHIPQVNGFWEKFYFRPGNLGYPVFTTAVGKVGVYICYDRHFPEGPRMLGLHGAELDLHPVGDLARSVDAPAGKSSSDHTRSSTASSSAPSTALARKKNSDRTTTMVHRTSAIRAASMCPTSSPAIQKPATPKSSSLSPISILTWFRKSATRGSSIGTGGRRCMATLSPHRIYPHGNRSLPMTTMLLKNGRVITATDDYVADVYVEGEKIKAIGQNLPMPADKTLDVTGRYIIPGGIDVHTHMDLPFGGTFSADDFETGTIAAAHGGTTTIVDFAVQSKGTSMHQALDTWLKKADGKVAIDYGIHLILTELPDEALPEMDAMVKHEGVTSFKLFTAYPGVFMADDATIFKAMKHTANNGGLICMHAENGGVIDLIVQRLLAEGKTAPNYHALSRPDTAEEEAAHRVIALSEMAAYQSILFTFHRIRLWRKSAKRAIGACRPMGRLVPIPIPGLRGLRRRLVRRRKVYLLAANPRACEPGTPVDSAGNGRLASRFD